MKGGIYLPSGAVGEGEVVADLPLVLAVDVAFVGVGLDASAGALRVAIGDAQQEVEGGVTAAEAIGTGEAVGSVIVAEEGIVDVEAATVPT